MPDSRRASLVVHTTIRHHSLNCIGPARCASGTRYGRLRIYLRLTACGSAHRASIVLTFVEVNQNVSAGRAPELRPLRRVGHQGARDRTFSQDRPIQTDTKNCPGATKRLPFPKILRKVGFRNTQFHRWRGFVPLQESMGHSVKRRPEAVVRTGSGSAPCPTQPACAG